MQRNDLNTDPNQPDSSEQSGSKVLGFFKNLASVKDWIDSALAKINNLTETNYELGLKMARDGRNNDAIFRFRVTLWLAPNHEPSMYNLACLYQHKGEKQKALSLLTRIIKANPAHANAIYRVATLDPSLLKPELQPTTVPPIQVMEYFDTIAPFYDASKQEEGYRMPALLYELLRPLLQTELAGRRDMIDIGCSTGLCGTQFSDLFTNMIGVDISANMLEQAHKRVDQRGVRIYSQLVQQDIRHYLARSETPTFDAALAIDLLPYLGDAALLCEQLGAKIRAGGIVAIGFTPHPTAQTFGVLPQTGYFAHNLAYVTQSMNAQGFETIRSGEVEASTGEFVQLCFFKKMADANPA